MRVLIVTSIISAAIAAIGVTRGDIKIASDSSPSLGSIDVPPIPTPFMVDEDYDPRPHIDTGPLPSAPFVANLIRIKALVRLHYKHDYG